MHAPPKAMRDAMKDMKGDSVEKLEKKGMVNAFSTMGAMIDITGFDVARPGNKYISVTMYSDGDAQAKKKLVNERATSLARACGLREKMIYGDAFLARTFDNEKYPW